MNENFVNTWVSNFELERTPNKQAFMTLRRQQGFKPFDKNHPFAQAIMKGWKKRSPVDALVISPELELMGRQPINELFTNRNVFKSYLTFLQDSLDGKLPGFGEDTSKPSSEPDSESLSELDAAVSKDLNVILTHEKPKEKVLNIFRTPESGHQDYTVVEIDTTAFKGGGVLTIDILVGSADPMGSFDLYDADTELPTEGMPHGALASAWDVYPSESGTIEYHFDRSKVFKLGATGSWFSEVGSINAFLATISVIPTPEEEDKH